MQSARQKTLDVYLLGRKVGCIDYSSHHNEMRFTYDPAYIVQADAMPISFSLPLQADSFDTDRTTAFFENLLPPDEVRRKLETVLHLSRHNIFGFLEAIGGDCAGAISIWSPDSKPSEGDDQILPLTDDEAENILNALKKRPLYVNGIDGYRISGAGAQNKLIVRIIDGKIALPLYGTPSTHIIKPAMEMYPDSIYNETFAMQLAKMVGLKVAKCGIMSIKGKDYYWTERFDRETVAGRICRLHQEDFCQIVGMSGELKYESEGGPSFATCMSALSEMHVALSDKLEFIDRMIFNYLIGNADSHGKNSSVIYRGGTGISLAPLYDVMCTMVYEHLSHSNAMYIGGESNIDAVKRGNFAKLAEECGMREALVLGRLDAMSAKILGNARKLKAAMNEKWPSSVYGKVEAVIENHVSKTLAGG